MPTVWMRMRSNLSVGEFRANLTEGSIGKQLVLFALPLLGSSLIQQMYNTVDLIFIGQLLGTEASAAAGSSSLLIACLVGFFTGLGTGSNVLTARYFGSRSYAQLRGIISMSLVLSVVGGAFLMWIGYAFTPVFLRWMAVPGSIRPLAVEYLRIYNLSLIAMTGYNIGSGILRGLGNSRAPMCYQLLGGICNIGANALFIAYLDWGVRGAAIATLCSQTVAAMLVLIHLCRLDERYRLRLLELRPQRYALKSIMTLGVPAGIQTMMITLSNLIVQNRINHLGVDSIAAFTVYFKVELFIYLPIVAIGQANVSFCGQNLGANRLTRAVQGTKVSLLLGMIIAVLFSGLLLCIGRGVFHLFSQELGVIETGMRIARITFPFYFLYVFLEVFASFVRGAGRTLPPAIIILVNMCLIRPIYASAVLAFHPATEMLAWVYPITWLTTGICMYLCYRKILTPKLEVKMNGILPKNSA